MKILITGATGLLGKEVYKQLIEQQKHSIRCLVRNFDTPFPDGIEVVKGNILDITSLNKALKGIDIVIHAAAKVSFHKKEKQELFNTNVNGTANIVNACLAFNIQKLVYVSSVAAIGHPDKALDSLDVVNVKETFKWTDSPNNSAYAQSKYLAELEVWRGQAEGLKTVIVNPSVILGEGEFKKSSTQLFYYVYNENPFYTDGNINYVDVKDVAHIMLKLMESNTNGERFILNAGKVNQLDLFKDISIRFKKKSPRIKLGKRSIAILWRVEALRSMLTGAKPLITKETANSTRTNVFYENSKIKERLNYDFIPLKTSIQRVCKYLLKNQN